MNSKKIIIGSLFFAVIIVSGCNSKRNNAKINDDKKNDSSNVQFETNIKKSNVYENKKYNFTIKYPNSWHIDNDKMLAGPLFMSETLNREKLMADKIDKNKDCFFSIAFLLAPSNRKNLCKNKVSEKTIGTNKVIECKLGGNIEYRILHPKTDSLFVIQYLNNPLCKNIVEESIKTLTFK